MSEHLMPEHLFTEVAALPLYPGRLAGLVGLFRGDDVPLVLPAPPDAQPLGTLRRAGAEPIVDVEFIEDDPALVPPAPPPDPAPDSWDGDSTPPPGTPWPPPPPPSTEPTPETT